MLQRVTKLIFNALMLRRGNSSGSSSREILKIWMKIEVAGGNIVLYQLPFCLLHLLQIVFYYYKNQYSKELHDVTRLPQGGKNVTFLLQSVTSCNKRLLQSVTATSKYKSISYKICYNAG